MKKKLLFVSAGLRIGGVERALIELLGRLDPEEYDVSVFLYSHDGELMDNLPKWVKLLPACPDYECLDQPIARVLFKRPIIALMRLLSKLVDGYRRLLGKKGSLLARSVRYCQPFLPNISGSYDVAVSFLCPHDVVFNKVRSRLKLGWIHTDYMREPVDVRFERSVWLALDRLAAVTDSAARAFEKKFGMKHRSVFVVPNIVDVDKVRASARQSGEPLDMPKVPDSFRIFTSARLAHEKGVDLAVEAASILKQRGHKFVWYVAGSGVEAAAIRRRISVLGLDDSFKILGWRVNPYAYMANCDIYVQPSRHEGFGIAIVEAQSLGCPVVTTRFDAVHEVVMDGVDGLIADPNPTSIAALVSKLISSPSERAALSDKALRKDFDQDTAVYLFRQLVA